MGGVVEEILMAEEVERAIVAEMLNGADSKDLHPYERHSLRDPRQAPFLGLRYFYGYAVKTEKTCPTFQIVYH